MGKRRFYEFEKANSYVVDKDKSVDTFIKYMLVRTQSMFTYTGLPDTIPSRMLEYLLQTKGNVFITEVDGVLYALSGASGGEPDAYGEPTQYIVSNPALKLSKSYDIQDDGILVKNDALEMGLLPILNKYGALICENTITIRTVDIMLRIVAMISASDDKTYMSAEKFIRDIENGRISSIGESAFFQGVKLQSSSNTQNYLTQFIELEQYFKASCYNEIGLNANYNMKRSALGANESAMNDDLLLPLVDDMIKQRQEAIERVNEKYGTEISIDYASAWKVTHSENEKQVAIAESIVDGVESDDTDISINQKQGIHDINQPIVNISETEPKPVEADESEKPVEIEVPESDEPEHSVETVVPKADAEETEDDDDGRNKS